MHPIASILILVFFALLLVDGGREVANHDHPKEPIDDPTDFYDN